ncbi:hypothetical protein KC316_g21863, partial [Hortaea werneckii]
MGGMGQMHPMGQMNQMGQVNQMGQMGQMHPPQQMPQMNGGSPMGQMNQPTSAPQPMPPPSAAPSAPNSQLNSPNVSPPQTYSTYSSNPGSYMTRNVSGDVSPAAGNSHRPMDINLLATAASQVERENNNLSQIPNHNLSLPSRHSAYQYHNHPYGTGRMPSLSHYHYSSNPTSQPMSRAHS